MSNTFFQRASSRRGSRRGLVIKSKTDSPIWGGSADGYSASKGSWEAYIPQGHGHGLQAGSGTSHIVGMGPDYAPKHNIYMGLKRFRQQLGHTGYDSREPQGSWWRDHNETHGSAPIPSVPFFSPRPSKSTVDLRPAWLRRIRGAYGATDNGNGGGNPLKDPVFLAISAFAVYMTFIIIKHRMETAPTRPGYDSPDAPTSMSMSRRRRRQLARTPGLGT